MKKKLKIMALTLLAAVSINAVAASASTISNTDSKEIVLFGGPGDPDGWLN